MSPTGSMHHTAIDSDIYNKLGKGFCTSPSPGDPVIPHEIWTIALSNSQSYSDEQIKKLKDRSSEVPTKGIRFLY